MTITINALLFLSGVGIGAFITALALILCMKSSAKSNKEATTSVIQGNADNLVELRRRNDIGDRQVAALESIAEKLSATKMTT